MKGQEKRFSLGGTAAAAAATEETPNAAVAAATDHRLTLPVEAGAGDETGDVEGMGDALAAALAEMEERFETVSTAILNRLDDMSSKVDELEQQLQSILSTAPEQQHAEVKELQRGSLPQREELQQRNFVNELAAGERITRAKQP